MQEIIDKWGNKSNPNNYLFNLIKYTNDPERHKTEVHLLIKRINSVTKKIGKELSLGNITTYVARHAHSC